MNCIRSLVLCITLASLQEALISKLPIIDEGFEIEEDSTSQSSPSSNKSFSRWELFKDAVHNRVEKTKMSYSLTKMVWETVWNSVKLDKFPHQHDSPLTFSQKMAITKDALKQMTKLLSQELQVRSLAPFSLSTHLKKHSTEYIVALGSLLVLIYLKNRTQRFIKVVAIEGALLTSVIMFMKWYRS